MEIVNRNCRYMFRLLADDLQGARVHSGASWRPLSVTAATCSEPVQVIGNKLAAVRRLYGRCAVTSSSFNVGPPKYVLIFRNYCCVMFNKCNEKAKCVCSWRLGQDVWATETEERLLSHMVKIRNVLAGRVAWMGSTEMHTWFWWGTLKEWDRLETFFFVIGR
jgi:hypothetical protein